MAQLSDDCFAVGGPLLTVDQAAALIAERLPVIAEAETVPVWEADGRVAAATLTARCALPPFANSAVDGFAVCFADLAPGGETVLPVRGRLAAGHAAEGVGAAGAAVRIFTGAPMPPDADTVFMQEDVRVEDGAVRLPAGLKRGANARPAGEDIAAGAVAVPEGRRLTPPDLALIAATGHATLPVRRRLRVALFSTGDELVEPGAVRRPGTIHDSNRVLLAALLRRLGAVVSDLGILRDEPASLCDRLAAAARDHDLILTSGGVSTGEEDHVKAAVEAGGRLDLWRLAIKPGRPVAMGRVGDTAFVGLPGNPVAAYVTLLFVVRPLLARLSGEAYRPAPAQPARAAFGYRKKAGRREYVRVSLRAAPDGSVEAVKFPREGAGLLTSLCGSDGLAELPEDATGVTEGDRIAVYLHPLLW
ncbi:molybdopterin molybdotransferase MoeA [Methylobacterium sp. JK268]